MAQTQELRDIAWSKDAHEEIFASERRKTVKSWRLHKTVHDELMEDIRKVCSKPEGVRLINKILGLTGVFRSAMTGNSMTYYNLGQNDLGFKIFEWLTEAAPEVMCGFIRDQSDILRTRTMRAENTISDAEAKARDE